MTTKWNPRTLDPSQIPAEWDDLDRDIAERLRPDKFGFRTAAQKKQVDAIRAARWLLLRNDHRARCSRCNAVHPYVTLGCIERPFNTLHEIDIFEMQQAREQGLVHGENIILEDTTFRSFHIGEPVPITRKAAQKLTLRIRAKLGRNAI